MKIREVLQGRFLAHPLHPFLVHIPVGTWIASLVFDIIAYATSPTISGYFVVASWYSMLVGMVAAVPSAITGFAEFLSIPFGSKARELAIVHMAINILLVVAYVFQLSFRDLVRTTPEPGWFGLNIVQILALCYSGYLGGRMAYEFRIGSRAPSLRENERPGIRRVA